MCCLHEERWRRQGSRMLGMEGDSSCGGLVKKMELVVFWVVLKEGLCEKVVNVKWVCDSVGSCVDF